ncbi:DUF1800 domain-containing protein [Mycobacterium sp. URHB0044]|uniref:DUF1800 domain-containing protein n=1 Tax=Mycobacterium sp. URHB0044 TaxID=1380386 RepID=UPI00048AAE45|nr:DUF1800 domain-containing protein [Mycobacterium sp. URHB0044]
MSGQSPRWQATARLLRRTGFGATGPQIDAVANQDWSAYLDTVLALDPDRDPGALATPRPTPVTPPMPSSNLRAAQIEAITHELAQQMHEMTAWWVRRMAAVQEPIHEKLTLLWHNHFATSAQKVPVAEWMGLQNQRLRTLKLGDFRTLALTMLSDAAMLYWLDGVSNSAKSANENLSREFMELFTLGHANGYSELDVREGARALTGWGIGRGGQTAMAWDQHDSNVKTVLGVTGNLDHTAFCDAVLSQPQSAAFVAGKLWRQLASDEPPSAAALGRFTAAYGPGRDLKALTKAILLDPEFTARAGTVVCAPIEWTVGVIRALKVPLDDQHLVDAILVALTVMRQRPFYPPDVDGWPYGRAWLSTTSTTARVWAADKFSTLGDLSTVADAAKGDRIDATGYLIGIGAWTDRTAAALKELVDDPQRLVAAAVNSPEYLTV